MFSQLLHRHIYLKLHPAYVSIKGGFSLLCCFNIIETHNIMTSNVCRYIPLWPRTPRPGLNAWYVLWFSYRIYLYSAAAATHSYKVHSTSEPEIYYDILFTCVETQVDFTTFFFLCVFFFSFFFFSDLSREAANTRG